MDSTKNRAIHKFSGIMPHLSVFLLLSLGLLLAQCTNEKNNTISKEDSLIITVKKGTISQATDSAIYPLPEQGVLSIDSSVIVVDEAIDSTRIGLKGNYKLVIRQIRYLENVYVKFKLYQRTTKGWKLHQRRSIQKDPITRLNLTITDFNNDGYQDMAYQSQESARGSNELKTIWLFNSSTDRLFPILNSDRYPNLEYNKELNCLDAWAFYGGCSTIFLKIEADTLREFAGVEQYDNEREVYILNKSGKRIIIKKDHNDPSEMYTRYSNYRPLQEKHQVEH